MKELDEELELYLSIKPRLNPNMIIEIWEWERFNFNHKRRKDKHTRALEKPLPETWKLSIARNIENNLLSKMPFLSNLADMGEIRTLFSAELLMNSQTRYFPAGTIIADSKERASGIFVITSGQVSAELPIDSEEADLEKENAKGDNTEPNPVLYVFGRGESIGSSCVVGDFRWAGAFGVSADFVALSHCSAEFIPLEAIQTTLNKFEYLPIKCKVIVGQENWLKYSTPVCSLHDSESNPKLKTKTIFLWTLIARQISIMLSQRGKKKKQHSSTGAKQTEATAHSCMLTGLQVSLSWIVQLVLFGQSWKRQYYEELSHLILICWFLCSSS